MSERPHHNLFWELEALDTVALPRVVPFDKLKPTTLVLYVHLLLWQQRAKDNPFPAKTGDLLEDTGLCRETLIQARKELETKHRLILATDDPGEKGVWLYQILDPMSGGPLPNRDYVSFKEQPDSVVLAFYEQLVGKERDCGAFDCPSCKREGTATVTLARGTDKHGGWSCGKCHRFGGFIPAYQAVRGVEKWVATRSVRATIQSLRAKHDAPAPVERDNLDENGEVVTP